jgi:hypothetical protein
VGLLTRKDRFIVLCHATLHQLRQGGATHLRAIHAGSTHALYGQHQCFCPAATHAAVEKPMHRRVNTSGLRLQIMRRRRRERTHFANLRHPPQPSCHGGTCPYHIVKLTFLSIKTAFPKAKRAHFLSGTLAHRARRRSTSPVEACSPAAARPRGAPA